jgi:hypothetical protein
VRARRPHGATLALGLAGMFVAFGCGKEPPPPAAPVTTMAPPPTLPAGVRVTVVSLGSALRPDKSIAEPKETFKPSDTIYATVATDGSSAGTTLKAKWSFQDGQTVDESSQTIAPQGPAVTEFHISKPSGWPKGGYKVEVFVDGALAGMKEFKVS